MSLIDFEINCTQYYARIIDFDRLNVLEVVGRGAARGNEANPQGTFSSVASPDWADFALRGTEHEGEGQRKLRAVHVISVFVKQN